MRNAAMVILFGLCTACSNQPATAPTPSTVAPATAPTRQGAATPAGPSTVPTTSSGSALTPATSGVTVLNQFDPPVPIQVNR
jgi:hypothetical protein